VVTEELNEAVREHEVNTPWTHRETAQTLHRWFDLLNAEFFEGMLPVSFLRFEPGRRQSGAYYRPGRNGVGALHEIHLNTRYLDRPLPEVLAALLHGMAHQWQALFGAPGKGDYHNRQLAAKCAALGVPCRQGYRHETVEYRDPFVTLLRRHGVEVPSRQAGERQKPEGSSRMKKWRCRCTNIRAAVALEARCLRCGEPFRQSD
jgi:hypothetical protein